MNKDELLNRVIEMVESYIEDQPNMQYYPTIYALRLKVLEELKNNILIPKPKFNIGDICGFGKTRITIEDCKYSILDNMWSYFCMSGEYDEDELQLILSKENNEILKSKVNEATDKLLADLKRQDEDISKNMNAMLDATYSLDDEIDPIVDNTLYSDDMYDEVFEPVDISKLFQHTPLKHIIYDNEIFIVVANSINFEYYDGVDIRIAHENICNPGYNQYGLILQHIEMDGTNNSLVMQTWDKSRTMPIGILEYAMETAELILTNKNKNKIDWLNTNIKYLKKFKNEIKDIPYILELVDKQIIEYEIYLVERKKDSDIVIQENFKVGDLVRTNSSLGLIGKIVEIKNDLYYLSIDRFDNIYSNWYRINQFTKWQD